LSAQYISNRLNIGFGAALLRPLNRSTVILDDFRYQSLYGNYPIGLDGLIFIDYLVTENLSAGISASRYGFSSWTGNPDLFILEEPGLKGTTLTLDLYWFPQHIGKTSLPKGLFVHFAPLLSAEYLNWTSIQQSEIMEFGSAESRMSSGFLAGIGSQFILNNRTGFRAEIYSGFIKEKWMYCLDKVYIPAGLRFSYYFRFMKNTYYQYD